MISIPPSIESFSAVAAGLCLVKACRISRDYIGVESLHWKQVMPSIVAGQCMWTIQGALRRALLTFAGISLLSAAPSEFGFAELFGILVTGPLTAGHAVAATGALLVYAYHIGKQAGLPWPVAARTAQSILPGSLVAFCLATIDLPAGIDALAHAFRITVVPALSIFALLPLYRLFQGQIQAWGMMMHDAFPERLSGRAAFRTPASKAAIVVETSVVPDTSSPTSLPKRKSTPSFIGTSTQKPVRTDPKSLPAPSQGELFTFLTKPRRRKR